MVQQGQSLQRQALLGKQLELVIFHVSAAA